MQAIRPNVPRLVVLGLLSAAGFAGCTDSTIPVDPFVRVAISGTVSLDGAPLPTGVIQFDPASETKGPQASGEIVAGKFTINKAQGPVAGQYKVSVSGKAPAKVDPNEQPGGTPKLSVDPVPAKFNTQSTLRAEIPAGGSSTLEFALKK